MPTHSVRGRRAKARLCLLLGKSGWGSSRLSRLVFPPDPQQGSGSQFAAAEERDARGRACGRSGGRSVVRSLSGPV